MTLPVWRPTHAYLVTARTTPTAPDGNVFWVTIAGTSGVAEPTWPTADPWTVVDGTVTWGLASSERAQMRSGVLTTLQGFQAANPTMLAQVAGTRPKSLTNMSMPAAYIADRDETDVLGSDIRTRTFSGLGIVLCDVVPDNAEAGVRMDDLVDGVMDLFTKYYHAASGRSIVQPSSVTGFQPPEEGLYCQLILLGGSFSTRGTS